MVSIEAREGVTTGISAGDRARTIAVAVDPASGPEDLVQPGHVFPLRARPGGVLERAGRTEAAVDLTAGAGLRGAGVLCQVMRDDGHMATGEDLEVFAARHGIAIVDVSEVVERAPRRRARRGGEARRDRPADARRDGPLRHRRLGRHRARRRGRPGRHHRQRDLLGLARPAAAARLPGAQLRDPGGDPRRAPLRGQHPRRRAAPPLRPLRQEGRGRPLARGRLRRPRPRRAGAARARWRRSSARSRRSTRRATTRSSSASPDHLEHREPGAKPLLFYRGSYSEIQIEEDELAA